MESIDVRSFFTEFKQAIFILMNADLNLLNHINHVGFTKAKRTTRNNISTVERQVIEKVILIDNLTRDLPSTLQVIKQGFELIGVVGKVLGAEYADILTLRYAKGFSLRLIAKVLHTSKTTAERKLNIALDWLDATPESYIKNSQGIAEKM